MMDYLTREQIREIPSVREAKAAWAALATRGGAEEEAAWSRYRDLVVGYMFPFKGGSCPL